VSVKRTARAPRGWRGRRGGAYSSLLADQPSRADATRAGRTVVRMRTARHVPPVIVFAAAAPASIVGGALTPTGGVSLHR
jgi:hypothetical protein